MKIKIKDTVKIVEWDRTKNCISKTRRALTNCSIKNIGTNKNILSIPLSFVDSNKIRLGQEFIISVKLIEVLTE